MSTNLTAQGFVLIVKYPSYRRYSFCEARASTRFDSQLCARCSRDHGEAWGQVLGQAPFHVPQRSVGNALIARVHILMIIAQHRVDRMNALDAVQRHVEAAEKVDAARGYFQNGYKSRPTHPKAGVTPTPARPPPKPG